MQNRYVGDIGDYVKLAILRKLARDRKLGVAWWLFPDENHNGDGGHREYMERPEQWKRYDPGLFDALVLINNRKSRDVRAIEDASLLPNAVFARDKVPCDVRPFAQRPEARQEWLSGMRARFKDCDVLFLDPDNGVAPPGLKPTLQRAGKSVFAEDITALTQNDRPMIVYHHQTRRKGGHQIEICHIAEELRSGGFRVSGVLRAKPWSPRAFFILNGDEDLSHRAVEIPNHWDSWISWNPKP